MFRKENGATKRLEAVLGVMMVSSAAVMSASAFSPSSFVANKPVGREANVARQQRILPHGALAKRKIAGLGRRTRGPRGTVTPTATELRMGMYDPLATEGDWSAYLDEENTGLVYYFNGKTGESLWEPPTKTFPDVSTATTEVKEANGIFSFGNIFGGGGASGEDVKDGAATATEPRSSDTEQREANLGDEKSPSSSSFSFSNIFGGGGGGSTEDSAGDDQSEVKTRSAAKVGGAKKYSPLINSFPAAFRKVPFKEQFEKEDYAEKTDGEVVAFVSDQTAQELLREDERRTMQSPSASKVAFPGMSFVFKPKPKGGDVIIPLETPLSLEVASLVLPHPDKVRWGGEDAVFCKGRTFGVFDGVSGADKLDGVPLYSATLAEQMKRNVGEEGQTIDELRGALLESAEYADSTATGASTAVVASIGEDGFLRAINLGDSVVMVLRDDGGGGSRRVVAKSRENSHYFDCPYQLADDSPDRPKDCTKLKVEMLPGDLVVMGSDGIFDNLAEGGVCAAVADALADEKARAVTVAKKLVDESRRVSLDTTAETPYAKLAKKNRYEEYPDGVGGKVDDVSCVVVQCS